MAKYTDEWIDAYLTSNGVPLENFFVDDGMVGFIGSDGRLFDLIIEIDEIADAAVRRLTKLGAVKPHLS